MENHCSLTGKGKKQTGKEEAEKGRKTVRRPQHVLETVQWLRALLLSVDPGSNPTPTWWDNTVCNPTSRVSNTLLWPPETLHTNGTQTYTDTHNSLKHQAAIGLYNRKQETLEMGAVAWRL